MDTYKTMATVERLHKLMTYNHKTGEFHWRHKTGRASGGSLAGHKDKSGYVQIRVDGTLCLGHRLAWAMHYGEWPQMGIDHINGDKHDNRISNLRLCCQSQNTANAPRLKSNKSGVRGVYWHKQMKKWHVQLCKNRIKKSFGLYDTLEEAAMVAQSAGAKLHGEFANHQPKQLQ